MPINHPEHLAAWSDEEVDKAAERMKRARNQDDPEIAQARKSIVREQLIRRVERRAGR